jgi:hypothetical protein
MTSPQCLYLETSRFRHPKFVQHEEAACCVGEDFAAWLISRIQQVATDGFRIGEPIEEDYGCGFWVEHGKTRFWVALSYAEGQEPVAGPAHWVVQVAYDPGPNIFRRFVHRPDPAVQAQLEAAVFDAVRADSAIRVLTEAEWKALADEPGP